ncbi:MAG: hypothetical protein SPE04_02485 [Prevotella sp.]|nr:hypothetical protein [Prevotella sp.]
MSFNNTKTPNKTIGKAKWQVPMRPHHKGGKDEYYLEGELKERFCQLFPKNSNRRLMKWFGISFSTLQRFKRELGLQKDMRAIRKQLSKDIKKTCEKNGYYDSLRGHAPSEACQEATRKMWADGFHPMKQLKANNPRRYKLIMRKRSELHKEIVRKERMRMVYGLERRTKLHLPLNSLTHAASACKYMMIRQCNYFADPDGDSHIICYDSETRRSARREATAAKHGLKVVEADE